MTVTSKRMREAQTNERLFADVDDFVSSKSSSTDAFSSDRVVLRSRTWRKGDMSATVTQT